MTKSLGTVANLRRDPRIEMILQFTYGPDWVS